MRKHTITAIALLALLAITASAQRITPVSAVMTNTGTPADDEYYWIDMPGYNDAKEQTQFLRIGVKMTDTGDASEDAEAEIYVMVAGTATKILTITGTGADLAGDWTVSGSSSVSGAESSGASQMLTNSGAAGACYIDANCDSNDDAGDNTRITFPDGGGMVIATDKDLLGTLATKLTMGTTGILTMKGGATLDNTTDTGILALTETVVAITGNQTVSGTAAITGALTARLPVQTTTLDVSVARTITSADYGQVIMFTNAASVAVTLPANGAAAGSWVDIMLGSVAADAIAITVSAASADTLIGPNDIDLDSVTWGTGHRIGAYARFISNGGFWQVINMADTTMTYTD